jgi:hypothetical protein
MEESRDGYESDMRSKINESDMRSKINDCKRLQMQVNFVPQGLFKLYVRKN